MGITNITESKPTQEDTLSLIQAIEDDFSTTELVLIKADWVMQSTVQQLQDSALDKTQRELLITQLNAAIHSVQKELYQSDEQAVNCDSHVA